LVVEGVLVAAHERAVARRRAGCTRGAERGRQLDRPRHVADIAAVMVGKNCRAHRQRVRDQRQVVRLSALYQINPDWNLLIQQNYQNMQADGYWSEYPLSTSGTPLARNQVDTFNPAFNNDRYESTTLSGKLGELGRFGDIKAVWHWVNMTPPPVVTEVRWTSGRRRRKSIAIWAMRSGCSGFSTRRLPPAGVPSPSTRP
jgi:hypothetical protein